MLTLEVDGSPRAVMIEERDSDEAFQFDEDMNDVGEEALDDDENGSLNKGGPSGLAGLR